MKSVKMNERKANMREVKRKMKIKKVKMSTKRVKRIYVRQRKLFYLKVMRMTYMIKIAPRETAIKMITSR